MFEIVYNMATKNLMNFKCHGCDGNTTGYKGICPDLKLMFKNRKDGSYNEQYDCNGKAMAFVKKYGSSYISEIYHYLETSQILEQYNNKQLKIFALGCGFDPWYYAVSKYIDDNDLNINFIYVGCDNSINWNIVRPNYPNVRHEYINLTNPLNFDFNNYDFVVVDKCFSTIEKMESLEKQNTFLKNIVKGFNNINNNKKHTLIFREQARAIDLNLFDNFINNSINWKDVIYFYIKGRDTAHINGIINYYKTLGKKVAEIYNKDIIYNRFYNNGYSRLSLNSFFIQYSI